MPFCLPIQYWNLTPPYFHCLSDLPGQAVSDVGSHFGSILPFPSLVVLQLMLEHKGIWTAPSVVQLVFNSPSVEISGGFTDIAAF